MTGLDSVSYHCTQTAASPFIYKDVPFDGASIVGAELHNDSWLSGNVRQPNFELSSGRHSTWSKCCKLDTVLSFTSHTHELIHVFFFLCLAISRLGCSLDHNRIVLPVLSPVPLLLATQSAYAYGILFGSEITVAFLGYAHALSPQNQRLPLQRRICLSAQV